MPIKVIEERCPQNHKCPAIKVCPANALKQDGYTAPVVNEQTCIECNKCSDYCPMGALVGA